MEMLMWVIRAMMKVVVTMRVDAKVKVDVNVGGEWNN